MTTLKLMIHAPTPGALRRAQSNAHNLLKLDPEAVIEIVVNGPAVADALEIKDENTRRLLFVCNNSLLSQGLEAPEDLNVIPAAVQHIASQQAQGWSYMRA